MHTIYVLSHVTPDRQAALCASPDQSAIAALAEHIHQRSGQRTAITPVPTIADTLYIAP
jgi:hypothetical protein